jgi:hypothetical protein
MTQSTPAKCAPKSPPADRGQALIDDWQRSGLSKIAYARQHQIGIHRISYWLKRLRKAESPPATTETLSTDFIQVPMPSQNPVISAPSTTLSPVEILFPRGIALRVRPGVDITLLRTVITALGQVPC